MASPFQTLPDCVLQRLLAGVPLDDQQATAATCQAFRAVIRAPRFLAIRQTYGFAERGVVLLQLYPFSRDGLKIRMGIKGVMQNCIKLPTDIKYISQNSSTTDGRSRLFVSTMARDGPNQILAVDASSRRWRRITALPLNPADHCIEWHGGLLYVAGGQRRTGNAIVNSLHAFNETTDSWEELPPMPHACALATSGVIGNQLLIAGGWHESGGALATLQIYDIATRTWRVGAALPKPTMAARGLVVDGKLALLCQKGPMFVYDPGSELWTERPVFWTEGRELVDVCVHNDQMFVFTRNGAVLKHDTDGYWTSGWSPGFGSVGVDGRGLIDFFSESVLLG